MQRTIVRALERWVQNDLLSREQADRLRADLEASRSDRAIRAFAGIGAVLTGLGAILFVGSNWGAMGPVARVAVLLAAYAAAVAGAEVAGRRLAPWAAEAGWLVVSLVLGANIFLLAQIFNHSLTYWPGPFWWAAGALALGWARRSPWQIVLAVPLGLVALGWMGGGAGWLLDDQLDFLLSDAGLRPILPLVGAGLVALALLARRSAGWRFSETPLFRWGVVLAAVPLLASTAHIEAARWLFGFDGSLEQILILGAVGGLVAGALAFGRVGSRAGRPLLAAAVALFGLVLVQDSGRSWTAAAPWTFALWVAAVFVLALAAIWIGARAQNADLVNAGMAATGVLIVIQYFGWTFQLLDRSLVFVGGGVLLLVVSTWLERRRRALLRRV